MTLLQERGGYLYQQRPDVIPHGRLCNEELALWEVYYQAKKAKAG